jgi:hypothetical protein
MKIRVRHWMGKEIEMSVSSMIKREVDGRDHDRGSIEAATAGLDLCGEVIGRLVEALADKGLLSEDDVRRIAGVL